MDGNQKPTLGAIGRKKSENIYGPGNIGDSKNIFNPNNASNYIPTNQNHPTNRVLNYSLDKYNVESSTKKHNAIYTP